MENEVVELKEKRKKEISLLHQKRMRERGKRKTLRLLTFIFRYINHCIFHCRFILKNAQSSFPHSHTESNTERETPKKKKWKVNKVWVKGKFVSLKNSQPHLETPSHSPEEIFHFMIIFVRIKNKISLPHTLYHKCRSTTVLSVKWKRIERASKKVMTFYKKIYIHQLYQKITSMLRLRRDFSPQFN